MSEIFCIYHGDCADGFTAAWAVWKRHPGAEFFAGVHGENPPDVRGRAVVIVDFCYKREVILEMAKIAKSILILDHHKSAQAEMQDLPENVTAVFDMARSGAMMAWQYFHPSDAPPPLLVQHVQDRDLWHFSLRYTRAFSANLFSHNYSFDVWDRIAERSRDAAEYLSFVHEGEAIQRKHEKDVAELVRKCSFLGKLAGWKVPFLNCPYFHSSDAGNILAKGYPFAVCYYDSDGIRNYSLRSEENGLDVSEIAAQFGGGGHKHAAGFRAPLDRQGVEL